MKNKIGIGIYFLAAGILILAGPKTLFEVCERGETVMKCWWTVQAETGIGIIIAALGILYMFLSANEAKMALSVSQAVISAVGILIPSVLIGGCMNSEMRCQSVTFPVLYAIAAVNIIVALINMVYVRKNRQD